MRLFLDLWLLELKSSLIAGVESVCDLGKRPGLLAGEHVVLT